jgi:hypothetical protein
MVEVISAVAGGIAILTAAWGAVRAARRKLRERRQRKEIKQPSYPVRLICREANDFHPSSGYHEGLYFEIFNESEKPVTVRGFGLDIEMRGPDEWHGYQLSHQHPADTFPMRLEPNDAVDGYIDIEALRDEIHGRGESRFLVGWRPYVDVAGYGQAFSEIEPDSNR